MSLPTYLEIFCVQVEKNYESNHCDSVLKMTADDINEIFEDLLTDDDEDFIDIVEATRHLRVFRERSHMLIWSNSKVITRLKVSKQSISNQLTVLEHRKIK